MNKAILYLLSASLLTLTVFGFRNTLDAQTGYSRLFDGGTVSSIIAECTCTGATLILFYSFVDKTTHQYVYQPGVTILYAFYNIFTSGNYFLSTHFPVGICLVVSGNSCVTEGNPEGTMTQGGSSAE